MERWKNIKGYEGFYQVSNLGRVKSVERKHSFKEKFRIVHERILKPCLTKGYKQIRLCKNSKMSSFYIHRLLAIAFIPNLENKPHINHLNGIITDNSLDNLEWCTHQENMTHAWNIGLIDNSGEKCGTSKLTKLDVAYIRKTNKTQHELAKQFKVSQPNISDIINNKTWTR